MNEQKKIVLKPSHLSLFWWYLLAVLMIPAFGLGIILAWRFYSTHKSIGYEITDRTITSRDSRTTAAIDIANIKNINVSRRWIDKKFGIGDLHIQTGERTIMLLGMEQPEQLSNMILQAAEAERKRIESLNIKPKKEVKNENMSLDKLDYLTGLWQQGLLSDEDYRKEKRHFE
jgi:uncharacterized membrane protein YdbT with pleckstrin-like domain